MKRLLVTLSLVVAQLAQAQAARQDGAWLKKCLDAMERVESSQSGPDDDLVNSVAAVSFINGIVSVHRQNNLQASLLVATLSSARDAEKRKNYTSIEDAQIRATLVFVPLLALPDDASGAQLAAIIRKHIAANPEKWNQGAHLLVVEALRQAFARR